MSLSPLSIQMEYSFADADGDAFPLLFFRMTDGSLCGWGQIVGDNLLGPTSWNDRGTIHCDYAHPLRSVLDCHKPRWLLSGKTHLQAAVPAVHMPWHRD